MGPELAPVLVGVFSGLVKRNSRQPFECLTSVRARIEILLAEGMILRNENPGMALPGGDRLTLQTFQQDVPRGCDLNVQPQQLLTGAVKGYGLCFVSRLKRPTACHPRVQAEIAVFLRFRRRRDLLRRANGGKILKAGKLCE